MRQSGKAVSTSRTDLIHEKEGSTGRPKLKTVPSCFRRKAVSLTRGSDESVVTEETINDVYGVASTGEVIYRPRIVVIHQGEKVISLDHFFKTNTSIALGFSGGVDSSYLLYASMHYGAKVKAYYVKTAFQPDFELQDAYRLAVQIGVEMTVLELNVLDNEKIVSNPLNRCYYCKTAIFGALKKQALADGLALVIDGSNASDDADDRPGMKALTELSVRSPLRECGITKDEVRRLSKKAGLFTWDKPAYACLATRIPSGRTITKELLHSVEKAEDALFMLGFTDFRVRVFHDSARLQFPQEQMIEALNKHEDITKAIKPYFPMILLDLEGR